jgi:hypothetical protein
MSMAEIAGHNARTLRLSADVTLQDLARAVRPYGLEWSTGRVGDFEGGRAAPNLATLLVVAAALGDVIGRRITLADLFAGKGDVAINEKLTIPLSKLRAVLTGEAVAITAWPPRGAASGLRVWSINAPQPAWSAGLDRKLHWRVLNDFREADTRMCKNIGVDPDVGAAAMATLWKKTFVAERDELAGPDAKAQRRGQISRRLKAELQELIG